MDIESQPAVAGDSIKPGVKRSGTPGDCPKTILARGAGDSVYRDFGAVARSAGCGPSVCSSWGSATLHPRAGSLAEHLGWGARLYAIARYRGLAWISFRVVIVLLSPFWLLFAACQNPSGGTNKNNDPTQKVTPPRNSPIMTGPITYLALGDSTGSGVGATEGGGYVARLFKRIVAHRPGSKLVNLCFSGATTSDVLRDQLDSGVRSNPQLVTLGIGINDIGHGLSLEQFSKNYEEILSRLKNNTQATIVVTNIPDISSAPRIPVGMRTEYHQLIVEYNRRLTAIAAAHGVIVFDIYAVTHEHLPSHPEYFSDDGFHPSDKGYELWAERMWPTIAQTIGVDASN